ncbi:hypothetical protein LJC08_05165 [Methanimicrococcus sp. OttesenSCG-928-J09]|nr:hypothetical protein [Methanimicrococcus sp. OttesenSCG-928-J09]
MISSKNIRFHAPSNTYIIPKNSIIDQNVAINGNVIVGPGTHFWKNAKIDGNIQFGKGCTVEGNLRANQIIVGSRSKIKGKIIADADVSLFQNAAAESIESKGNITIMPGCVVGYANGSTLQVIGKAEIKKIGVITKVTVRADTVAELPKEPEDSENLEELEFAVNTPIRVGSENEMQNISENLIFENSGFESNKVENSSFENKKIDEPELSSVDIYNKEIITESSANTDSSYTPAFQVETPSKTDELAAETDSKNPENSGVEIIDENDENSPKSFSFSEFSSVPVNRPIDVPTDESEEVEIVDGTDESDSDSNDRNKNENFVPQTVETPFGTIVVGENPASTAASASASAASGSMNRNADRNTDRDADSTFASVTEISKEDQQADFEAEIRSKTRATPSKVEFRWPSFEAKPTRKTGLRAAAERQEREKVSDSFTSSAASVSPVSSASSSPSSDKMSAAGVQYEEVKVQNVPRQKESFAKPENDSVRKANQKIVFEEIAGNESAVKYKQPQTGAQAAKQPQSMKQSQPENRAQPASQTAKQALAEDIIHRQTKTEIRIETVSAEAIGVENRTENKSERKEVSQIEIERSKIWYEERYQEIKPRKKEYPPYI